MNTPQASVLLTDMYQLAMLQGYLIHGMCDTAVFEFFVRRVSPERNFLIAAGLEQVLQYLENLELSQSELQWLESTRRFESATIDYLRDLRFSGDVEAMPEGTVFFAEEPILRVVAPLPVAQLVESRIINLLQFQSMIASKAVRSVLAAPGKQLVDFGMRRAHGAEAALLAARATYLAGFTGTSNVQAGQLWNLPTFGTMAHSFIQAHDDEIAAFENFALANPRDLVLLIDTYDTEAATHKVVQLAAILNNRGIAIQGVRIDSGDLSLHARQVRKILDAGGLSDMAIVASGNLDEHRVAELVRNGAPIDSFGIGTRVDVSADAPYWDCAYKLQEYAGRPRLKQSEHKATWPGRKQVIRRYDRRGCILQDTVTLETEDFSGGEPLLQPVMRSGQRTGPSPSLSDIRQRVAQNLSLLPAPLRSLAPAAPYDVQISWPLRELAASLSMPPANIAP